MQGRRYAGMHPLDDASQAKLLLPDPGKYYMLAMRHGSVELACCINPDHIDDDDIVTQVVSALCDAVKSQLLAEKAI